MFIPLTVGGGVRQVEDVRRLLNAGADKVSINTAAVQNPQLVREASSIVGCQCIVVAIDAKTTGPRPRWEVFTHGGRKRDRPRRGATGRSACRRAGAGEILLTSMDRDGTREGFDLELTRAVSDAVGVPVIASRRRRHARAPRRGRARRPRRRGARRERLPFRRVHACARRRSTCAARGIEVRL